MKPPDVEALTLDSPVSIIEMRDHLEMPVDAVLSRRRSVPATAETLRPYGCPVRQPFLESVEAIARTGVELGFNFYGASRRHH